MGSLVLLGLAFHPRFLYRPDGGHLVLEMVFAFPVLVYVIVRVVEPGDRQIARLAPGRAPRHLFSFVVVASLLAVGVPSALRSVSSLPRRFTPDVEEPVAVPRLGYATADALPANVLADLRTALDAVLPDAAIYDFSNQPAIVTYLLDRPSPTRYFHVSLAIREPNQHDLLDHWPQPARRSCSIRGTTG